MTATTVLGTDDLAAIADVIVKLADVLDLRTDVTRNVLHARGSRTSLFLLPAEAEALRRLFAATDTTAGIDR